MAAKKRTRSRISWLDDRSLPFLWTAVTPFVSVPLSAALFIAAVGSSEPQEIGLTSRATFVPTHVYAEVLPTLLAFTLPGLVNLAPLAWVVSSRRWVRAAAIASGLVGLLRLAIPAAVLMLAFSRVTGPDGTAYFEFRVFRFGVPPSPYMEVWFAGLLAWLGTLAAWNAFSWLVPPGERAMEPLESAQQLSEAGRWEDAIVEFDRAIWFHPRLVAAWCGRAAAYAALGEAQQAIADLGKALSLAVDARSRAEIERRIAELGGGPGPTS